MLHFLLLGRRSCCRCRSAGQCGFAASTASRADGGCSCERGSADALYLRASVITVRCGGAQLIEVQLDIAKALLVLRGEVVLPCRAVGIGAELERTVRAGARAVRVGSQLCEQQLAEAGWLLHADREANMARICGGTERRAAVDAHSTEH